jgi:hypothetical protein
MSQSHQPLFVGIASTDDVLRYLRGVGYATIDRFEVGADTTHAGGPPSGPPSRESIWATSTQGTGEQTLRWDSRAGDWSVVVMNADAGSGVAVHGDASAVLPILPWLGVGLPLGGVAAALVGGRLLLLGLSAQRWAAPAETGESSRTVVSAPVQGQTGEEVNA